MIENCRKFNKKFEIVRTGSYLRAMINSVCVRVFRYYIIFI